VGLVTAACFAELGHEVVGTDHDEYRLATLQSGRAPFHEPGLQELMDEHAGGRLTFVSDPRELLDGTDAVFICVHTPLGAGGRFNMAYLERAARTVVGTARAPIVIVEKSTAPVRTARRILEIVIESGRASDIEVATDPEFTREGEAVINTLHPDRIVIGLAGPGRAEEVMRAIYAPLIARANPPFIVTDLNTAEMIKHACNSFLAMKISYVNAVAELCEQLGADVSTVSAAMGLDPRIGPAFLRPGVGYGGSCFPKDVTQFVSQAREAAVDFGLLEHVQSINARQRVRLVEKIRHALWNLDGKTVAVWGLSFKPGTDDLREAPSLDIVPALAKEGAIVRAYDPAAGTVAREAFPDAEITDTALEAAQGADGLIVLTEWPEFEQTDLAKLREVMERPVVVDGRNVWPVAQMAELGFTYISFGRPQVVNGQLKTGEA
jgi:UDPglucose 6-dehydrogenase